MADRNPKEEAQGVEANQEFKNAGNANAVRQAGEGLASARAAIPTPGDRLTGAETRAEAGRNPRGGGSETERAGRKPADQQRIN
jgi:hypothetical protein